MRIGCKLLSAGLVASWLAGAQPSHSPFASISGVVINDATGAPIRHASVTLFTLDETPLEALTFSESNGAFGFNTIPPGKYRLHVDMEGFQHASFGASTPSRPPGTLTLSGGDIRYGITFRLHPLGSISGVVLDPDGDAIPNAELRLLRNGWQRLKPTYQTGAWATSDDRGQYRFADVIPGDYVIMAAQRYQPAAIIQPEATVGQTPAQKMYAVQFFPDSSRLSSATPLHLAAGEDLDDIDFHLVARAVAAMHGRVAVPADLPADASVQISVFPEDLPNSGEQSFGAGAMPPDFNFEIPNLLSGPYILLARLTVGGRDYYAVDHVDLAAGGQEVTLRLEKAIELNGRVELEGQRPTGPFRVALIPAGFPPGRNYIQVDAQPDGTFVFPNLVPGIWDINVEPVPAGGFIKAMRLGDSDVLTEDMIVEGATNELLRIVVSSRGAVVEGTVKVPPGVIRSARASVLLAPCDKYAHVLSFYAFATADDSGHFEFKGITPGRYRVYAFEELDRAAYLDPSFLKPFETLSEPFDVPEGGRLERETQLILTNSLPAGVN